MKHFYNIPKLFSHYVFSASNDVNNSEDLGQAEEANWFSKLFFLWVKPLMVKGDQNQLNSTTDLFHLPKRADTYRIAQNFHEQVEKHLIREYYVDNVVPSEASRNKFSFLSCLNASFGCGYYVLGILKFLSDSLGFVGPILLNRLMTFMEDSQEPKWHGYVYAFGLMASTFTSALLAAHFNYHVQVIALKFRTAIISTVFTKLMMVRSVSLSQFSTGQIVNFMSIDTDRIVNFCPSFHSFWSLPIQVAVALYLLNAQIGLSFLVGVAFCILLIPLNRIIAKKIQQLSTQMMTHKDDRVKVG